MDKELDDRFHKDMHEWMEKHNRADEIVVSEISGLPLKAIYYNPVAKYTEDEIEELAKKNPFIKILVDLVKKKNDKETN
jgi:hypothetical protein